MSQTVSTLAAAVANRLEESPCTFSATPVFWSQQDEIYSAIVEAVSDLLLLVGRPTQYVQQPLTLVANSVWQTLPKGLFLLSNLYGPEGEIRKVSLYELDYTQASWSSYWQQDVGDYPLRWAPLGFNQFIVHPAPSTPININVTAIQYATANPWPYTGAETIPFHDEFNVALEMYATHYCRLKEMGDDAFEGVDLYNQYLALAQRFTMIEDKRDTLLFSRVPGAISRSSPILQR